MSVIELPKYKIDPSSELTAEEQAARLHFKKNRPEQPDIDFPAYRYMPYPRAVYREWDERAKQIELRNIAARMVLNLSNPHDYERALWDLPEYESRNIGVFDADIHGEVIPQLREKNEADHRLANGQGWADSPAGVKELKDRANKAVALDAAHLNYEDRNLIGAAKAEREAVDDAADQHVREITAKDVKRVKKARTS